MSAVLLVQRQLQKHLPLCILMHMKWGLCIPHPSEIVVAQCNIIKQCTTYAAVALTHSEAFTITPRFSTSIRNRLFSTASTCVCTECLQQLRVCTSVEPS